MIISICCDLQSGEEGKRHKYNDKRKREEDNQEGVHFRSFRSGHEVVPQLVERGHVHQLRTRGLFSQADHLHAHQGHDDQEVLADERQVPGVDELYVRGLGDALARLREEGGQHEQRCEGHHDAVLEHGTISRRCLGSA